ncbi:MAG: STAS domain-containing protein [Bacteriovoracaceae bacterium]
MSAAERISRKKGRRIMSMKANILRDSMGNIIIQMEGDLGYEHSMPLRSELKQLADDNPHSKITIDLGGIDFVGSSGICHFVETLQLLNKEESVNKRIGLSNVGHEFKKVFRLYTIDEAEVIWDEFGMNNDETKSMNMAFGNRKRTFEN